MYDKSARAEAHTGFGCPTLLTPQGLPEQRKQSGARAVAFILRNFSDFRTHRENCWLWAKRRVRREGVTYKFFIRYMQFAN